MYSRDITNNFIDQQKCCVCDSKQNLAICLTCGYVACTHLERDHMFDHFVVTLHNFSQSFKDKHVHDLSLGIYVNDNVLTQNNDIQLVQNTSESFTTHIVKIGTSQAQTRFDITEFQFKNSFGSEEKSSENHLQFYERLIHVNVEALNPTDNCLKEPVQQSQETNGSTENSEENKLMHAHVMANMKDLRLQNEDLKSTVKILTEEKQEKDEEIHQLRQDLNEEISKQKKLQQDLNEEISKQKKLQQDLNEEISKQKKLQQDLNKEISKNEKLQKRLNNLERECAQEQVINEQLRQNQIDLKRDLEIKTTEIQELKDQMRDLMFHLDGEQKLKQLKIADELETSEIVVGAPQDKIRRQKRK